MGIINWYKWHVKFYLEAKKIVDQAQDFAYPKGDEPMSLPYKCGLHLANRGDLAQYEEHCKRPLPYRASKEFAKNPIPHPKFFEIWTMATGHCYSIGNEELNKDVHGPDHNIHSVEDLIKYTQEMEIEFGKEHFLASPALMSLKSEGIENFVKYIELGAEKHFSYWCVNYHGPSYVPKSGKQESGIGYYELMVRQIKYYLIFASLTHKPVIITELGNGDGDNVLSPFDCRRLYKCMDLVFKDRLYGVMFYNSGLMEKMNGKRVLESVQ